MKENVFFSTLTKKKKEKKQEKLKIKKRKTIKEKANLDSGMEEYNSNNINGF